jgi:O-antigen/teichoic acid export membrane protein
VVADELRVRAALPSRKSPRGEAVVLKGSLWMLMSVVVAAASAAAFWLVAARLFSRADVGAGSALFSSVIFTNFATGLGLPIVIARFASDDTAASRRLFSWCVVLTTLSSIVGTVAYIALVPQTSIRPLQEWGAVPGALMFFVLVAGASIAVLVDVRWMALRRWSLVLLRNALVGICRFLLLAIPPVHNRALWVFLLSAAPPAASGFLGGAWLLARRAADPTMTPIAPRGEVTRFAAVNYLATLASQAALFALPVIVLVNVSAPSNASFFVAWSIVSVVFLLPVTVGQVLLIEGARTKDAFAGKVGVAFVVSIAVTAGALVLAVFGSQLVVVAYGHGYREAAHILPILMAAGLPWAFTATILSVSRVRKDNLETFVVTFVLAATVLVPAAIVVPRYGLNGASAAWLAGNAAASFTALAWEARRMGSSKKASRVQPG